MAKILDKTVIGMNAPKQTNVTWIDTSDGTPVLRNNINGKWKPVGSGAGSSRGGSSNPTESDVNKVWQVTPVQKGTLTKETVIVPEQTCNMREEKNCTICTLQNVDESFGEGFSGIAILDGIEYNVEWPEGESFFEITESVNIGHIGRITSGNNSFQLSDDSRGLTHTIKVITRETEPIYDYNWVPGVKIPVPTAKDEGKILVVTKTEGDTSTIVPEQEVPVDNHTPLTDVDLTKFVAGNTVKVTVTYEENGDEPGEQGGGKGPLKGAKSANSQTFTATRVIELELGGPFDGPLVLFLVEELEEGFVVLKANNSLYTDAISVFGLNSTIKLEYVELNYEYQLQENNSGSSTSNVLWPAMYEYNENEVLATFVPEDVEPNTWCMVYGEIDSESICLPVLIEAFSSYILCNVPSGSYVYTIDSRLIENGELLLIDARQIDSGNSGNA